MPNLFMSSLAAIFASWMREMLEVWVRGLSESDRPGNVPAPVHIHQPEHGLQVQVRDLLRLNLEKFRDHEKSSPSQKYKSMSCIVHSSRKCNKTKWYIDMFE